MKVLAFGGSNSKNSINKQFALWVAQQIDGAEIDTLDLNDFEMPIYSIDRELENGLPELAIEFGKKIDNADLVIISLAENNGTYNTAFKNIFDWISRIPNRSAWGDKDMLLLSTAPGPRGGATALEIAANRFPYNGGKVLGTFSLPKFQENFHPEKGILDIELNAAFANFLTVLK